MTQVLEMDVQDVAAFVRARMEAASVDADPFPHLLIKDVFPADYYQSMVANWPANEEFADLGGGAVFGLFFRPSASRVQRLGDRGLFWPTRVRTFQFWKEFRGIVQRTIIPVLAAKLSPAMVAMMRPGGAEVHPEIKGEDLEILDDHLIIRRNRHVLAPHIDDLRSIIQLLIYLPEDDSRPHLGTQYFRQLGDGRAKSPCELQDPRLAQYASHLGIPVAEVKRIPFARNTLVANVNFPRSWHGQHLEEAYDRKGYQAFIGVRPDLLRLFFDDASASLLAAHAG